MDETCRALRKAVATTFLLVMVGSTLAEDTSAGRETTGQSQVGPGDVGPSSQVGPMTGGPTSAGPGTSSSAVRGLPPVAGPSPDSPVGESAPLAPPGGSGVFEAGDVPTAIAAGLGGGLGVGGAAFNMIGDRSPFVGVRVSQVLPQPGIPGPGFPIVDGRFVGAVVVGTKIADNQSPRPQDRVFASFFYYDDLFASINRRLGSAVRDERFFRQVYGVEKTFLDRSMSIGLQLPVDTLSLEEPRFGGSSTAFGDLTAFFKALIWQDPSTGSLLSSGLAVTAPSGRRPFAGFTIPRATSPQLRSTDLQPFLGYILSSGRWYLQGFLAVSVPTDNRDLTLLYNDVGVGYFLHRSEAPGRLITAVAPTLEVHVNNPLNNRSPSADDPIGAKDAVDLTAGLNIELYRRAYLSAGLVTPVTGPRPFDVEVVVLLNVILGPSASRRTPPAF